MQRFVRLALVGLFAVGWFVVAGSMLVAPAIAAPWEGLFKKVEADPEKVYHLTQDQGPWMIMAASFSGDGCEQQARELVLELRKKFKVEAYMYDKVFDYSEKLAGTGVNRLGEQNKSLYRRNGRFKEIAVVCGNFIEIDDPAAQKLLQKLKYADVDSMRIDGKKKDHRSLGGLRQMQAEINRMAGGEHAEKAKKGPLGHAFITTNPLLPDEYFRPKGVDAMVVKMNEPVRHSLLKCPAKYTVKVATFTGAVIVDPKKIKELEESDRATSRLAKAAEDAHLMTTELRRLGYEAYEYHDRNSSIVCVGSFDNLGNKMPDGKIDLQPKILRIMDTFGATKQLGADGVTPVGVGKPKQIIGIVLDVQPQIVEVPKQSISGAYARETRPTSSRTEPR